MCLCNMYRYTYRYKEMYVYMTASEYVLMIALQQYCKFFGGNKHIKKKNSMKIGHTTLI